MRKIRTDKEFWELADKLKKKEATEEDKYRMALRIAQKLVKIDKEIDETIKFFDEPRVIIGEIDEEEIRKVKTIFLRKITKYYSYLEYLKNKIKSRGEDA